MKLKKIFGPNLINKRNTKLNIFFLSEGFISDQEVLFWNACKAFLKRIHKYSPFNYTHQSENFWSIYGCYAPSEFAGPATSENSGHKTLLNARLDVDSAKLSIDFSELKKVLNQFTLKGQNEAPVSVDEILSKKAFLPGFGKNLLVVLLPEIENSIVGGEIEKIPSDSDDYYYVATSLNGYWEQVVIRALAGIFGLGDEFSLEEEDFEQPLSHQGKMLSFYHPNLIYVPGDLDKLSKEEIKWRSVNDNAIDSDLVLKKSSDFSTVNKNKYHIEKMNLWEGGGGYRKHIFRSSQDCLLGYKIGDISSPIKAQRIPLCPVCEHVIKHEIFKSETTFGFPLNMIV